VSAIELHTLARDETSGPQSRRAERWMAAVRLTVGVA